jgi:hypothetical protein
MIPSPYDLGRFSRVYDLFAIVGKEFKITAPQNITTHYFPTPNIRSLTNATYVVDSTNNTINLKINNIDYTYQLENINTKRIIIPILLGEQ